ncbi:MAG: hypothetical protein MJZ70_07825 [Bacteroidales bacterium]|nr:hypothetical protein [Bacteroidales bacterium]
MPSMIASYKAIGDYFAGRFGHLRPADHPQEKERGVKDDVIGFSAKGGVTFLARLQERISQLKIGD